MTDLELFLSCLCAVLAFVNYRLWSRYCELAKASFILVQGIKSVAKGEADISFVEGEIKLKEK